MRYLLSTILLACTLAVGCEQKAKPIASSDANPPTPVTAIGVLSWMQGYWTGEQDGTRMEEVWLPARGNVMIGMHVDLFASGRSFFEYLRIEQRGDTLVFLASPRGRPPTPFIASGVTDSSVTFQNPDHDFPQEISYRLEGGQLHAGIAGIQDGTRQSVEWVWSRSVFPNRKK